MRHCLFFQGKRFIGTSCSESHDEADLIENHFQVTPSSKSLKNMSAQAEVAFKVFQKRPQKCSAASWEVHETGVCWDVKQKKKRSSNPLEVWIRVTPPLCGFSLFFFFF